MQRFSGGWDYFCLTKQLEDGYISPGLREFSAYYSNRLSYQEVEKLIKRISGEQLLSDQGIWGMVVDKAAEISQELKREAEEIIQKGSMPEVAEKVDIYHAEESEVLLFDDGIQVREQKPSRDKSEVSLKNSRVGTDVVMLEKKEGGFHYLCGGIDSQGEENISLEEVVKAQFIEEYSECETPLKLVAITDGAKSIRKQLFNIFGIMICLILDWYHLCKKVRELMSMIAQNKKDKQRHLDFIIPLLWRGKTNEVLEYLSGQVTARNQQKLEELITYLNKHKAEIIDYERRQKAGKCIGSGRMEKGVDQVIGFRQKKKGMSWRKQGSKALAILRIAELNGQWNSLWFPESLAA